MRRRPKPPPPPLLTVADVAALLRRSPRFVRRLVRDGRLLPAGLGGAQQVGANGRRDYRFTRAALDALLAPPPGPPASGLNPMPRPARTRPCRAWDGYDRS